MNHKKLRDVIFLVFVVILIMTKPAQAYLDPGTGSYIIQILIAVGLSSIFVFKKYLSQIFEFIKNIFKKNNTDKNNNE